MTIQFLWSIVNRGDFPNTTGLQESINTGTLSVSKNFIMCYEHGLELPHKKLHLYFADYDYRRRYWANIITWIDSYCPDPNFNGYLNLDIESFPMFNEDLGFHPELSERWIEYQNQQNKVLSYEKHYRDFMRDTVNLVKLIRPKAKIGFWGLPSQMGIYDLYKTEPEIAALKRKFERMRWFYQLFDYFLPAIYLPRSMERGAGWKITEADLEQWVALNINEHKRLQSLFRIKKETIPCLSTSYAVSAGDVYEAGERLTEQEFQKLLEKVGAHGYNRVCLWDAIDSTTTRDSIQQILSAYEVSIRRAPIDPPGTIG